MLGEVSVERVTAASEAAIDLVVAAGSDPAAFATTSMPAQADRSRAHAWLRGMEPWVFLVRQGDEPVAILAAHRARSPGVPAGFLETHTYVVPAVRGRHVAAAAWALIEPLLVDHAAGLAGVTWAHNDSACRRLQRSGYHEVDGVWYTSTTTGGASGWCRVWIKKLAPGPEAESG